MKTDRFSTNFLIHVVASPFFVASLLSIPPFFPDKVRIAILCSPPPFRSPLFTTGLYSVTPAFSVRRWTPWAWVGRRAGRDRRSRVLGRPRPAQESTQRATRWVNAAALSPITPLLLVPPPGFPFARDPSKSILLVMVVWRRLQKFVPFCFTHRF
jgi:hypothetical protein